MSSRDSVPPSPPDSNQKPLTNSSVSPKLSQANEDKPFQCKNCPLAFRRNHDLKRHSKIHLPVRPYICSLCEKGFNRKDALHRHVTSNACKAKFDGSKTFQNFHNKTSFIKKPIYELTETYNKPIPGVPASLTSSFALSFPKSMNGLRDTSANKSYSFSSSSSFVPSNPATFTENELHSLANRITPHYISSLTDKAKTEQNLHQPHQAQNESENQQQVSSSPASYTNSINDSETRQLLSNLEFVIDKLAEKKRSHEQILHNLSLPGNETSMLVEKLLDTYNSCTTTNNTTSTAFSHIGVFDVENGSTETCQANKFDEIPSPSTSFFCNDDGPILTSAQQQPLNLSMLLTNLDVEASLYRHKERLEPNIYPPNVKVTNPVFVDDDKADIYLASNHLGFVQDQLPLHLINPNLYQ